MGCGASADEKSNDYSGEFIGSTRFTNPALFRPNGLRFTGAPEGITATSGFHPRAKRCDDKRSLARVVKTNEGGMLVFPAAGTAVDCLFFYPEFNAVADKTPTASFGMPLATAAAHAQADEAKGGASAQRKPGLASKLSSITGSVTEKASALVGDVSQAISSAFGGGGGGGLIVEDADDDFSTGTPGGPGTPAGGRSGKARRTEGMPRWTSAVCQFKEFDSLDDIPKPWYRDAGGGVPGVLRLETGGAAAAWATLQPHRYQQRWALPDGDRVSSFSDDSPSIPQRIFAAYKTNGGDQFLRELIERVQAVRRSVPDDVILAAFDIAELGLESLADEGYEEEAQEMLEALALAEKNRDLDVEGLLESLRQYMTEEKMGSLGSVYQLPDAVDDLKAILGYVEDALLYNWFEVAVEAEMEVGTQFFLQDDKGATRQVEWRVMDSLLRRFLKEANELTDDAFDAFRGQLGMVTEAALRHALDADNDDGRSLTASAAAQRQIDALFPDIRDMVQTDARSLDAEMIGIHPGFPEDDVAQRDPAAIEELFRQWRQEDARPLAEKRAALYAATVAEFEAMCGAGSRVTYEAVKRMGQSCRFPRLVPRHFFEFTFVLLFPRQEDHAGVRKPSSARLCIWPEGCLALEQKCTMNDFTLPDGGVKEENPLVEKAADLYDGGDDEIDTSDDPRRGWDAYPSSEWRGFVCTAEVALDVVYNYNFELDGRVFLDHNSFVVDDSKEYFRRIRFRQQARPLTFNPLAEVGLVPK